MHFQGLQALTVDIKGRTAIPMRYRSIFQTDQSSALIITIDLKGLCLWLYTLTQWNSIVQKLQTLPSLDSEVIRLQRLLIGHALEVELDSQGRFLIPSVLRNCVGLSKHVVLMGQGNRFELWDTDKLVEQRQDWIVNTTKQSALADKIQEIVF